jgi:CheY-like chemotaxis protein
MATTRHYPFAVRLIGFAPDQAAMIEQDFAREQDRDYGYFRLHEDSLQDPDLFLANANDGKTLVALSYLGPSEVRPVLLVGSPEVELPYPCLPRPIDWSDLFDALDKLVEKRADALSRLEASDLVTVPERRRKDRLDLDLTDPSEYGRMRRPPVVGGVLVIDKNAVLADYVAELLIRRKIPVWWTSDEASAIGMCKQQKMSIVITNTSTPGVDPYRLCETVKAEIADRVAVIFLVGKTFTYDTEQARRVGCEGFLSKPLTSSHLVSALKKFLPQMA